MPIGYFVQVMYQKNVGSRLGNDSASSERKSSEETRTSKNITDDSVTISAVCLLLGLSHLSLCVTNVHL